MEPESLLSILENVTPNNCVTTLYLLHDRKDISYDAIEEGEYPLHKIIDVASIRSLPIIVALVRCVYGDNAFYHSYDRDGNTPYYLLARKTGSLPVVTSINFYLSWFRKKLVSERNGMSIKTTRPVYKTGNCLDGCPRNDQLRGTLYHSYAFRDSDVLSRPLIIGIMQSERNHPFFGLGLMDCLEMIRETLLLLLIKERIERALSLRDPWSIGSDGTLLLPTNTHYSNRVWNLPSHTVKCGSMVYHILDAFWFDSVYYNKLCVCPLQKLKENLSERAKFARRWVTPIQEF
jgi:hypothetical protein